MIEELEDGLRIKGRSVSRGKVKGSVLKSPSPLSLDDDIDMESSAIKDSESEIYQIEIKDRVFTFPFSNPSEERNNVFTRLKERNMPPLAIIAGFLDVPTIQDIVIARIPAVDKIDISLFETGDDVQVNATSGTVDLRNVSIKKITTSIITSSGKILILKRSEEVGTYKGMWAGVSGYIEKDETADETALREISEELNLSRDDLDFIRKGDVVYARDKSLLWAIHPFLFKAKRTDIRLDWEHDEYRWIVPGELENYSTVPKLKETVESVLS